MNTPNAKELNAVFARLDRLERQNLWLRLGSSALACVVFAVFVLEVFLLIRGSNAVVASQDRTATEANVPAPSRSPVFKTVEAEAFILRDSDGTERGRLDIFGHVAGLRLPDPDGKAGVSLIGAGGEASGLFLHSKEQGTVTLSRSGGKPLLLFADHHEPRMAMELRDGEPLLQLYSTNNKVPLSLSVRSGSPLLALVGESEKSGVQMTTDKGEPTVRLYNDLQGKAGEIALKTSPDGSMIGLRDRRGNLRVGMNADSRLQTGVQVWDSTGKPIFSTPESK